MATTLTHILHLGMPMVISVISVAVIGAGLHRHIVFLLERLLVPEPNIADFYESKMVIGELITASPIVFSPLLMYSQRTSALGLSDSYSILEVFEYLRSSYRHANDIFVLAMEMG